MKSNKPPEREFSQVQVGVSPQRPDCSASRGLSLGSRPAPTCVWRAHSESPSGTQRGKRAEGPSALPSVTSDELRCFCVGQRAAFVSSEMKHVPPLRGWLDDDDLWDVDSMWFQTSTFPTKKNGPDPPCLAGMFSTWAPGTTEAFRHRHSVPEEGRSGATLLRDRDIQ